jgi:hypothetical protein
VLSIDYETYLSRDDGASWTLTGYRLTQGSAACISGSTLYIYGGGRGQDELWRSTDDGATWSALPRRGLPAVRIWKLSADPISPAVVWAATDIGVYRSENQGVFWSRYGTGQPWVAVRDIDLPSDGSRVRSGTWGRGVWEAANEKPAPPQIALALDKPAVTLAAGASAQVVVTVSLAGAVEEVALSTSMPAGIAGEVSAPTVGRDGSATITLRAELGLHAGTWSGTVTATAGSLHADAGVQISVTADDPGTVQPPPSAGPPPPATPQGGCASAGAAILWTLLPLLFALHRGSQMRRLTRASREAARAGRASPCDARWRPPSRA